MAQNITLQGASYSDVPAVTLPKTGGGTASFTDVSDTTAAASDVATWSEITVDGDKLSVVVKRYDNGNEAVYYKWGIKK